MFTCKKCSCSSNSCFWDFCTKIFFIFHL